MRVVFPYLPYPSIVRTHALHHCVGSTQVFVVAHSKAVGAGGLEGKSFHEGYAPLDCGVHVHVCTPVLLVAGFVNGSQGAYQETLVILNGTSVVAVVLFRKIGMHLHHLAGNGEPAHLR